MATSKQPLLILIVLLAVDTGCSRSQPVMLLEANHRAMTLEDRISMESMGRKPHATLWYTADELDWLARDYAARRGIDFDFKGAEVLVWIERDSEYLARVEYLQGLHEEMLSVWISRDGLAVKSQIAIAVDGSFIKALELKP